MALAKTLLYIDNQDQARRWVTLYIDWCSRWSKFFNEKEIVDGRRQYRHRRLRRARKALNEVVNSQTLFTYLRDDFVINRAIPSRNNRIEGEINAQLRSMLRNHRGMSLDRRIKAKFWWCYIHSEYFHSYSEALNTILTEDILKKRI